MFACGIPLLLSRFLPGSGTIRTIVLSPPPQSPPAAPSAPPPASAPNAPQSTQTLTTEDVATLIDVWRSVLEYTKSTTETAKRAEELLSSWPTQIKEDKNKVTSGLNNLRNEVNGLREAFATLATVYQRFPNIRATFQDKKFRSDIFPLVWGYQQLPY